MGVSQARPLARLYNREIELGIFSNYKTPIVVAEYVGHWAVGVKPDRPFFVSKFLKNQHIVSDRRAASTICSLMMLGNFKLFAAYRG